MHRNQLEDDEYLAEEDRVEPEMLLEQPEDV
jgi:hypothetical protein